MTTISTTSARVAFRRLAGCALIALASQTAFAQEGQDADPPTRVARMNYMAGTVTTQPAGATDWSYAELNRPLTTGDQLWNDANARSELHIGSSAVRLGASTSLDILSLNDSTAQLKVTQGTLSLRVRDLPPNTSYEIDTPNAAISVTQPGDYRVDVAPDGGTTTVAVRSGALSAYGDNGQVPLSANQQVTFTGTNLQEVAGGALAPRDAFDQWAAGRDAVEDRSVSARYVSRDIPGYEDLDQNGTWSNSPQYGAIWVPNAEPAGWAPYRNGHWAWIAPWGWTWIDDAPWGFAPYHYGRWAYVRSSWCWVPGPLVVSAPPVYAPALVAFVGGGGGLNWSINLSFGSGPGIAWFPLGPGEIWYSRWGGWSHRYYERVNQTVNININIHNTYINYRRPGAVTAVPADVFVHGRPTARVTQKVDPLQLRNAQINSGTSPVAPVRGSLAPGMRPASNHRPPQSLTARPVVATHPAPRIPALDDRLAQHLAQNGAKVPNAGQPVTGVNAPAGVGVQHEHGPAGLPQDLHVVAQNSPVIPRKGPVQPGGPVVPRGATGVPVAPGVPNEVNGHGAGLGPGHPLPHAPIGSAQPALNGVPRPTSSANANMAPSTSRHEPSWTQPHPPIGQQQPSVAPTHAAPNGAAQWQPARPSPRPALQSPQPPRPFEPHATASAQPQAPYRQPPVATPHAQPHFEPPRPTPYEGHPQPQMPAPQPQVTQPHLQPQVPHTAPAMPRPQPQASVPHIEPAMPRPQPAAQPPHPQAQMKPANPKAADHSN